MLTRAELDRFTVAEARALERHTRTSFHLLLAGAPVRCGQCHDRPPKGFTCNHCGKAA